MSADLAAFVKGALDAAVDPKVSALAAELGGEAGASAVLFYGSNLRSGDLDGVLDFYVLTPGPVERGLWPTVGYHEVAIGHSVLRAKVATMRLATFARAAAGETLDTTIWARFAQPAALVWIRDADAARQTIAAVAAAAITAGRYAAALGPASGDAVDYWRALFLATYTAEFRIERAGRHDELIARDREYYRALLPLAWAAGGVPFGRLGDQVRVTLDPVDQRRWRLAWAVRRAAGKPINIARLLRATVTFDGAARYGAWKIERHTGIHIPLTPWRERHPILASLGVLWKIWRRKAL